MSAVAARSATSARPDAPARALAPALARAIAVLALGAAALPGIAGTTTWNGTHGSWSDAGRWNFGVPGAADVAILNAGTATLSTNAIVQGLIMGGSSVLDGTGALQVSGDALWQAGRLTGLGSTTFEGALGLFGSGRKEFVGGRTVNTLGTTTWSSNTAPSNNQLVFANSTLNNSGAWIDSNAFNSLMTASGANSVFNNLGSYSKQGNATTNASVAFNNTGTVNVSAGRLQLTGGGSGNGVFTVAAGAVLDLNGGIHTLAASSFSGDGAVAVSGGTARINLNGGSFNTALLFSSGVLQGSDHTLNGPVTWTGGRFDGSGSSTLASTLDITGSGRKDLSRIVNTTGLTTWGGNTAANNNQLAVSAGTLNNSGTWRDTNAFDSLLTAAGANAVFNNIGTYNKLGNATTNASVAFNNTGTVNVSAGTLQVSSPFTNHGLVSTAAGATFLGSNATFVNAGVLAGEGSISTHANGDIVNQGGSIAPGLAGTGLLTLGGDLRNTATGALNFELASLGDFDQLAVTGDVTLGGVLAILNLGYVPALGDSFALLSFDRLLGASRFASVQLQGFAPGLAMAVSYNLHDVTVTVTAVSAVPEPGTWALMLAGLAGLSGWRTQRRSQVTNI